MVWFYQVLIVICSSWVFISLVITPIPDGVIFRDKTLLACLLQVHYLDSGNAMRIANTSMTIRKHPWIASLFYKYYIPSLGSVPRWSASHKYIKKTWRNVMTSEAERVKNKYEKTFNVKL